MADIMRVLSQGDIDKIYEDDLPIIDGALDVDAPIRAICFAQRDLTNQQWIKFVEALFEFEDYGMWLKDSPRNTYRRW